MILPVINISTISQPSIVPILSSPGVSTVCITLKAGGVVVPYTALCICWGDPSILGLWRSLKPLLLNPLRSLSIPCLGFLLVTLIVDVCGCGSGISRLEGVSNLRLSLVSRNIRIRFIIVRVAGLGSCLNRLSAVRAKRGPLEPRDYALFIEQMAAG